MGNQLGASNDTPRQTLQPVHLSAEDLRSYEDSHHSDQDVRKFDTELHARTSKTINALAAGLHDPSSFPVELLREVTGCFLETDQQVVDIILSSKKDIWKNPELFALVDDYFKTSLHTLDFCNAIEKFLRNARHRQIILRAGLQTLAEAIPGQDEYKKAIQDLSWFRSTETHFTEEMLEMFGRIYIEHLQMLQRLQSHRIYLDKKLKKTKSWRKTASIIFAATFITVLICSVVASAIAAPPLVTAVVAAVGAAAAFTPTGSWFKALWKGLENSIQEQREVVSSMQAGTFVAILDLDNIRVLVERLETEMKNLLSQINNDNDKLLVVEEDGRISLVLQEIEIKVAVFARSVDEMGEYVDTCSRNIQQARSVVLKRIMTPTARGNETQVAN